MTAQCELSLPFAVALWFNPCGAVANSAIAFCQVTILRRRIQSKMGVCEETESLRPTHLVRSAGISGLLEQPCFDAHTRRSGRISCMSVSHCPSLSFQRFCRQGRVGLGDFNVPTSHQQTLDMPALEMYLCQPMGV
ncbi:hypothetical protein BJ166DRAFT_37001 [Pestalotiopsis sp. NC0098]|nr:hypothetical protein BJ166DRAFT_37001 [Pestalotiopsis sp. NC0098]